MPGPLTIHCFQELLVIIPDFRCGRARGRAWIWLVRAASRDTDKAGGGRASNVASRVLGLVEAIGMGSTAVRPKISSVSVQTLSSLLSPDNLHSRNSKLMAMECPIPSSAISQASGSSTATRKTSNEAKIITRTDLGLGLGFKKMELTYTVGASKTLTRSMVLHRSVALVPQRLRLG